MINKLSHGHNFSLAASAFFVEDFMQTHVFVWICTAFDWIYTAFLLLW